MCAEISQEDWGLATQMAVEGRLQHLHTMHVTNLRQLILSDLLEDFNAASKAMIEIFTRSPKMVNHADCTLGYI